MNWPLFFSTFSLIFIAELPDKTAFATLLMATRGRPLAIFLGVASAFVIQSIVAVSFGSLIGMLPERWVHLGAGLMFIGFAYHTWFHHDEEEAKTEEETPTISGRTKFFKSAWKAFLVIFIAEWGDLTQLATASIAAHYHEALLTILLAATLALWSVTAIAIFVGHKVKHVIHATVLKKISTVVFVLVGFYFIWTWFKT
jgi:putative Ca2+/H+ antiporter (TMEM165/GDT1 family)